jgi:cyanophycinase
VDSFQPDILGDNRIVQAMTELLSSPAAEVRAMAARIRPDAKGDRDRTGFVFRLYRGADTQGWIDTDGDGKDVTLLDVRLDIRPVRLPDPSAGATTSTNAVPAATMIAPAGMR